MKKTIGLLLCLAMCTATAGAFAGCGDGPTQGALYSLSEAYDNGWLTQDDLLSIAYYHNGGRELNEELMPEDYAPKPKDPEELGEKTDWNIRNAVAKQQREDVPEATADGVRISEYCGTYNGCAVVMAKGYLSGVTIIWYADIGGVTFWFGEGGQSLLVWTDKTAPSKESPPAETPETLSAATERGVINAVEEVYRETVG